MACTSANLFLFPVMKLRSLGAMIAFEICRSLGCYTYPRWCSSTGSLRRFAREIERLSTLVEHFRISKLLACGSFVSARSSLGLPTVDGWWFGGFHGIACPCWKAMSSIGQWQAKSHGYKMSSAHRKANTAHGLHIDARRHRADCKLQAETQTKKMLHARRCLWSVCEPMKQYDVALLPALRYL